MAVYTKTVWITGDVITAILFNNNEDGIASIFDLLSAQGDMIYASAASTLNRLAKGTTGQILEQGATIPVWSSTIPDQIGTNVTNIAALVATQTQLAVKTAYNQRF